VAVLVLLAATVLAPAAWGGAPPLTPAQITQGRATFERECKACHGAKGDGQGAGARLLAPRPRDFTAGVFKLRSTPNGKFPADDDLFQTITRGMPGSMMPSFRELPETDRWALVAVVKSFARITKASPTLRVPGEPAAAPAILEKGRAVYADLKCANCHGAAGRGDGPSALTLKDDDGRRTWAPDLTRGVLKGGGQGRDLYLRIATGIDGTPMPSYADQASPDEIWALVHYLRSLIPPSVEHARP